MRHRRRRFLRVVGETLHVGKLQKFIKLSLVADRAAEALADIGAARRTRAMVWINHYVIGKFEVELAQCFELLRGQFIGVIYS